MWVEQVIPDHVSWSFVRSQEIIGLAAAIRHTLDALRWFNEFIHAKEVSEDVIDQYHAARRTLLGFMATCSFKLNPSLHYLTNHLWEDFLNYGPLYNLLEESAEAAHRVAEHLSLNTTRGRSSDNDRMNSWHIFMRRQLAAAELTAAGAPWRLYSVSLQTTYFFQPRIGKPCFYELHAQLIHSLNLPHSMVR